MTPAEYEWRDEQMQDVADDVRAEHLKTGRDVREILAAMRDEGYIECSDDALERCAKMALEYRETGETKKRPPKGGRKSFSGRKRPRRATLYATARLK